MSHSQFHSMNLFILRHAWLNLWDKHMTTGRINQVTIRDARGRLQRATILMRPAKARRLQPANLFSKPRSTKNSWSLQTRLDEMTEVNISMKHLTSSLKPDFASPEYQQAVQSTTIWTQDEDYRPSAHSGKPQALLRMYLRVDKCKGLAIGK
jgi:hypothetical protein